MDRKGRVESNTTILNTIRNIGYFFGNILYNAGIVMESSKVSGKIFLHLPGWQLLDMDPYLPKTWTCS